MQNYFFLASSFNAIACIYFLGGLKSEDFWKKFNAKIKPDKEIEKTAKFGGFVATRAIQTMMENHLFGKKQKVQPIKFFTHKKYTDEMMDWVRKNYIATDLNVDELVEKFNDKFDIDTTRSALSYQMKILHIKKDYEWLNKTKLKNTQSEEVISKRVVFTKKVIDFMKEKSKTMTRNQLHQELQKEFEHPFSMNSLKSKLIELDLLCIQPGDIKLIDCDDRQLKIITKYKELKAYEIRDKMIEAGVKTLLNSQILAIVRNINKGGMSNKEINETLKKIEPKSDIDDLEDDIVDDADDGISDDIEEEE